jgi:hypothetical protein
MRCKGTWLQHDKKGKSEIFYPMVSELKVRDVVIYLMKTKGLTYMIMCPVREMHQCVGGELENLRFHTISSSQLARIVTGAGSTTISSG